MMKKSIVQALAILALLCCMIAPAFAGAFSVSPVRLILTGDQPVVAMTVQNSEQEPTVVQLELVEWSQKEGKDVYVPTKDILATPPIFTLPANGKQIIRIGLRKPQSSANESAYRIFLHEVPGPPKSGFQGLHVSLKISVPIFIPANTKVSQKLRWTAKLNKDNQLKISAINEGNTHLQISSIKVSTSKDQLISMQKTATYILPMQKQEWLLKPELMLDSSLRISLKTDAGDMQTEINLDRD
jgi:fimbrial chaperone protein